MKYCTWGRGNGSTPEVLTQFLSKNPGAVTPVYYPELEGRDRRMSGFTDQPV